VAVIVSNQSARPHQPAERARRPNAFEQDKAFGLLRSYDLDNPAANVHDPDQERSAIIAPSTQTVWTRETALPMRLTRLRTRLAPLRSPIRCAHKYPQHQTQGINREVTFAPLICLAASADCFSDHRSGFTSGCPQSLLRDLPRARCLRAPTRRRS